MLGVAPRSEHLPGQYAREEELEPRRQSACPVPAVEAVAREELAAAGARQAKHVFDVRRRGRCRADRRRVEHASSQRHEQQQCNAASQLEPPRGDVPVRDAVAHQMCEQAEPHRRALRPRHGADGRPARDVQADDHRGV